MQNIYVVTHTQSQHHVDGLVGGWHDTGLTDFGQIQAEAVAKRLKPLVMHSTVWLISSDLMRAVETAKIIEEAVRGPLFLDMGFRENSYGVADGKAQTWLDERIKAAPNNNRLDHIVVVGAESKRTFVERIYASMSQLPSEPDIILITHGYALTFVIASWIGMRVEDAGYVNFPATPGGITHLQKGGFFQNKAVKYINDTSHLPDL